MCLYHEMIGFKENVTQALDVGEELLLTEFLRHNREFRRLPPEDRF